MAIIKHIAVKNANYDAAFDYLTTKYDEFECTVMLDEQGRRVPREEFLIDGILCDPFTFRTECRISNAGYGKNQQRNDIKSHHYIISFDPKDKTDNGLTMEKAQELGVAFAKKNFPGHQTLVCTHPDGHNGTGNIHIHIVINSLRIENVECPPFKERMSDCLAGMKHHVSKSFLDYLKHDVMQMCRRENLYQVDLLSPAKEKITDREYHVQRRGQAKLDAINAGKTMVIADHKEADATNIVRPGENKTPSRNDKSEAVPNTKYETQKGFLRRALRVSMENSHSIEELKSRLLSDYGIRLSESRGRFSFQIPDRAKPIRARQLGTDFKKESIAKYFEEKDGRAEMPVPDHAAHADQLTRNITDRPQPHMTPAAQVTKIPTTSKITALQKTVAPTRQDESQKSSLQTGNQDQIHTVSPNQPEHSTAGKPDTPAPSVRRITDLESCVKAQQNRNYSQKVKISNLKEMSNTMNYLKENGIGSVEELDALVAASSDDMESRKTALKSTESRLKTVNLLIRYSGQYFANKKVYEEYLQAKSKRTFREEHRTEIALYESARRELNQLSGGKPIPTMKQLKTEKEKLLAKKEEQYASFSPARSKHFELLTVQHNVEAMLRGGKQHTRTHEPPDGR